MKNKKLTFFQTFNAMRIFLSMYFDKHRSSDLGIILSSLRLFKDKSNWKENPTTWDPAAWEDWMDGVEKTLYDLGIQKNSKEIDYTPWVAFLCMKNYLQLFYDEISYEIIGEILVLLNSVKENSVNNIVWFDWLTAINHAINETYELDEPLSNS